MGDAIGLSGMGWARTNRLLEDYSTKNAQNLFTISVANGEVTLII